MSETSTKTAPGAGGMDLGLLIRLSLMMFLQYVIWGAWLPLLTEHLLSLGFKPYEVAWIQNAFAIGSFTAMFVGGQIADRYFSGEKFLFLCHLIGGAAMLALPHVGTFWPFFGLMLLHCVVYVPTLSVTNSVAFANLTDRQNQFGYVRLWGTIGWIAASWPLYFILKGQTGADLVAARTQMFNIAGGSAIALALMSLALPHTPPSTEAKAGFAPLRAMSLLAVPSILVLFIVTFIDSLVHYCYFFWTGSLLTALKLPPEWIMPAMSIGQIAEIGTMAVLGWTLKTLGWRTTMIVGILGHAVRFGIYSISNENLVWLVIASNVVHGICYAFFFASVYIFVDEFFPGDARTSAQTLFNFLILGVGPLAGNFLCGWLGETFVKADKSVDFNRLFLVPLGLAVVAALVLLAFFFPPEKSGRTVPADKPVEAPQPGGGKPQAAPAT